MKDVEFKKINYLFDEPLSGDYYATNLGYIIHVDIFGDMHILKGAVKDNDYLKVNIEFERKDGKRNEKDYYIHRLVAMAFIPNPDGLPQVNHKDYNRQNNDVSNLEWLSARDNTLYSRERIMAGMKKSRSLPGISGERFIHMRIRNGKTVYRVRIKGFPEKFYRTLEEAIRKRDEFLGKINNAR